MDSRIEKDSHITHTRYWTIERTSSKGIKVKIFNVAKSTITFLNKRLSKLGIKITRIENTKRKEQISFPSKQILAYRNQLLCEYVANFFSNMGFDCDVKHFENLVEEFDLIYKNQPISDLNGGMGYNNALFLFLFVKLINPIEVVESGVWRGFSTYMIDNATTDECHISCYDINLSRLEYKSKKADYYEMDLTLNEYKKGEGVSLAFFDDHVSHYDRLMYCIKKNIDFIVLDDDVSVLSVHSDGWPPIPTASMIFNYDNIPHNFGWVLNGRNASASIEDLNIMPILNTYHYVQLPELFEYTGYNNASTASFLVRKGAFEKMRT